MSKNRGFSDTTANRYSLALYELAEEANVLIKVEENSNSFLKLILTNNDFISLIKNPTITQEVLNNIINKIQENFQFDALFKNFLNFLILKRRFFYIEQILKSFNEICSKKRGELKAEINSAKKLSQDEINKISSELSSSFKSKIKLNYNHDESLIGGLVVQVGSIMIDNSLNSTEKNLAERIQSGNLVATA